MAGPELTKNAIAACIPDREPLGPRRGTATYYGGTSIELNPVLWAYSPVTNLIKLCYATTANSLACTPTKPVFAATPLVGDDLQYRISQTSLDAGLWIVDVTSNKEALCTAGLHAQAYIVTCTLASGIK